MNIRVSVVLPIFNGEKYLEPTLRGILSQTFRDFEVVIFDDGSSDSSLEVIKKVTSERPSLFKIHSNHRNRGVCETFLSMLDHCEGDFVFMLGQDDVWADDYLINMVAALDENPDAIAAFAEIMIIDGSGRTLELAEFNHKQLKDLTRHQVFAKLLAGNFLCAPGSAFKRCLVSSSMFGVNNERLQDHELWLNLIQIGDFIQVTGARCSYRMHQANLSSLERGRNQLAYEAFAVLSRILLSQRCDEFVGQLSVEQRNGWIIECVKNMLSLSSLVPTIPLLTSIWLERLQQRSLGSTALLRALRSEIALGMQLFRKYYQLKDTDDPSERITHFEPPFLKDVGSFDPEYFNHLVSIGVFRDGRAIPDDVPGRVVYVGTAGAIEQARADRYLAAAVERGDVIVADDQDAERLPNCLRLPAECQALSDRDTHRIVGHLEDTVQMGLPPILASQLDRKLERKIVLRFFWKGIRGLIPNFARLRIMNFATKWSNS